MKTATVDSSTRSFLERNAVFTVAEFRTSLPPAMPSSTVLNRLRQAHQRGYVDRIAHGVYASRVGVLADGVPDPLLIASRLTADYVVAYHSALEVHGVAHAPFRRVTILSARTPMSLNYRGYEYVALRPAKTLLRDEAWRTSVVQLRREDRLVTATSRERTLVDCLDRLKWAGGVEEVLRSVGGFPSLSIDSLIAYLDLLGSSSATARVGWVLSVEPDLWKVTPAELESLRSRLGRGPYFLSPRGSDDRRAPHITFVRDWRLYVPADLDPREALRG